MSVPKKYNKKVDNGKVTSDSDSSDEGSQVDQVARKMVWPVV